MSSHVVRIRALLANTLVVAHSAFQRADRDLLTIVFLFAALRFFMALFLSPGGHFFRNDGDYLFYRRLAELSTNGFYPFVHYWMEYPPVFPWLAIGVYKLSLLVPAWPDSMIWFQAILSCLLGLADLFNLLLVHRLATGMYGRQAGLRAATYYSLLFLPAWVVLGWFDTLPLFFLLLAISLSTSRRHFLAGLAAGIGLMTKLIPAIAAPAGVLSARTMRQRLLYVSGFALAVGSIGLPFLARNPTMTLASTRAMFGRSSWESVWSCYFEGYCGPGYLPNLADRFDPQTATIALHPETLPWTAITATLGVCCLWLYTRKLRWQDSTVVVPAVALTLNLLMLFSKGYSPQFLVYPLTLLIILKPRPVGVIQATLLTALNLIEHPFAVDYGPLSGSQDLLYWTVSIRTALCVLLTIEYALTLFGANQRVCVIAERTVVGAFLLVGTVGIAVGSSTVASQFFAANPIRDVTARISAARQLDDAIVASSRDAFYRARPSLPTKDWLLADEDGGQWPIALDQRLDALVAGRDSTWLILDQVDRKPDARARLLERLDRWGTRAMDHDFGQYRLIGYAGHDSARAGEVPLDVRFGKELSVIGRSRLPAQIASGQWLRVELHLRCEAAFGHEMKTFVHLDDNRGQALAQRDKLLTWRGQAATSCQPGDALWDGSDVLVPPNAAPGLYSVNVGFYDPIAGDRVPIGSDGDNSANQLRLAEVRVLPPQ